MANIMQKFIYNISAAAPLSFMFALVWYIQQGTLVVPLFNLALGIFLIIIFAVSFLYGKRNLPTVPIRVCELSPNDSWVIAYIMAYALPFVSMVISELNLTIAGIIACVLIVAAPYVNTAIPNPLLFFVGYHFYHITAKNGVSGYIFISKRKLRRSSDVKLINRVFEFLLLDAERR